MRLRLLLLLAGTLIASPSFAASSRGTILILPFSQGDRATTLALEVSQWTAKHLEYWAPAEIAFPDFADVDEELSHMAVYEPEPRRRNPDHEEVIVKYVAATHILRGSLSETPSTWKFDGEYRSPSQTVAVTKEVAKGETFVLASELMSVVMADEALQLKPSQLSRLQKPVFGADVRRLSDYPPPKESWPADNIALRVESMRFNPDIFSVSTTREIMGMMEEYPTGRLLAAYLKRGHNNSDAFTEDISRLVVEHPGNFRLINELNRWQKDRGKDAPQYEKTLREWYAVAPPSPYREALFAEGLRDLAWQYRGGGYINTVTAQGKSKFKGIMEEASGGLEKAREVAGPLPTLSQLLVDTYAHWKPPEVFAQALLDSYTLYPDAIITWQSGLHYRRPKWFGKDYTEGIALIDRLMSERPDNPWFGTLAAHFHIAEGICVPGNNRFDRMQNYLRHIPDARRQMREGAERMKKLPGIEGRAFDFGTALYLDDRKTVLRYLREEPEVMSAPYNAYPLEWDGGAVDRASEIALSYGLWTTLETIKNIRYESDMKRFNWRFLYYGRYLGDDERALMEAIRAHHSNPALLSVEERAVAGRLIFSPDPWYSAYAALALAAWGGDGALAGGWEKSAAKRTSPLARPAALGRLVFAVDTLRMMEQGKLNEADALLSKLKADKDAECQWAIELAIKRLTENQHAAEASVPIAP